MKVFHPGHDRKRKISEEEVRRLLATGIMAGLLDRAYNEMLSDSEELSDDEEEDKRKFKVWQKVQKINEDSQAGRSMNIEKQQELNVYIEWINEHCSKEGFVRQVLVHVLAGVVASIMTIMLAFILVFAGRFVEKSHQDTVTKTADTLADGANSIISGHTTNRAVPPPQKTASE